VDEAKILGGLVGLENCWRRPSLLRHPWRKLQWCHVIRLLSAVPHSGAAGRRGLPEVREQLGEDFDRLDLRSDGGRCRSSAARRRARRQSE
jgi:hypothetical protein